ncbi:superoxide dismutase family protein [Methylobacillus arboreus]|uniref:superoxide dismutase family protein n=1 Tax=Methylobacillus arboreus TaxID=755170 RepID=UPI001E5002E6|nr:superoxide dismutase family protein [Methylobacillus arboreus]MCB5191452.1 superoxide dismutase family protein [Methylobacillus arboreus]
MKQILALSLLLSSGVAFADIAVPVHLVDEAGAGKDIGQVLVTESKYGVVFTPALKGLTPGLHGFHLHQNPSCDTNEQDGKRVPAGAAGAHLDPANANKHGTPWGDGHLGDLPPLYIDANGAASQPVLAPRLKLKDVSGHALIIHAGGDNHSDHPEKLGGGAGRVACGVIR